MHARLRLAFKRHARTHDFGQTVNIVCLDVQRLFNIPPHFLGPGLCAENTGPQGQFLCIHARFFGIFAQIHRIRGCAGQNIRLKILKNGQLPCSIARRNRNGDAPQLFGTAVKP